MVPARAPRVKAASVAQDNTNIVNFGGAFNS